MSVPMFLTLLMILATFNSLLTEACKKTFNVTKPTILVGILAAITGWGGGAAAYVLMQLPFDLPGCLCLFFLAPAIWLCATVGYDKVKEAIEQLIGLK